MMALEYTSHGKHFFMQFGMENEHLICVRNIVGHIAPQHTVATKALKSHIFSKVEFEFQYINVNHLMTRPVYVKWFGIQLA